MPAPAKSTGKSHYGGGPGHKKFNPTNKANDKLVGLKPKHQRRGVPLKGAKNYKKWAGQNKGFGSM